MVHKLAWIAVTGITLSAVCLGAGAAIEANQNGGKGFADGLDFSMFGDKPRCEAVPGATATSRDLDWDGSDRVGLATGGRAHYTPGSGDKVHVSGDPQAVAHIRVRDGNIEMDCHGGFFHNRAQNLDITLPGRAFNSFAIAGSGNLTLEKLNQSLLKLSIAGSGNMKADGKVEHAEVHIAGAGDADLGNVQAKVVEVHIAGSGDTNIAPSDEADIHIAGSGDVFLHSNPKKLETHIAGSGRIHNVSGGS